MLPLAIVTFLFFPIHALSVAFTFTISDLAAGYSTSFPADATHVPTFYVPRHRYSKWFHALLLVVLGSIFGGIHCAGWNFPFPTDSEKENWLIAALAVTIIPTVALPFVVIASCSPDAEEWAMVVNLPTFITSMGVYAVARLALLGLALTLLGHLPLSAYIAVDWTKFYPNTFK